MYIEPWAGSVLCCIVDPELGLFSVVQWTLSWVCSLLYIGPWAESILCCNLDPELRLFSVVYWTLSWVYSLLFCGPWTGSVLCCNLDPELGPWFKLVSNSPREIKLNSSFRTNSSSRSYIPLNGLTGLNPWVEHHAIGFRYFIINKLRWRGPSGGGIDFHISLYLYFCIPASLDSCIPISLYPCIPVSLYPCISGCWLSGWVNWRISTLKLGGQYRENTSRREPIV